MKKDKDLPELYQVAEVIHKSFLDPEVHYSRKIMCRAKKVYHVKKVFWSHCRQVGGAVIITENNVIVKKMFD